MKATTALRVSARDPGPSAAGRTGISLFEVVLSLVILVSTLAAIGQLVSSGGRGAVRSRLLTQGVFLAESLMAEMIFTLMPASSSLGRIFTRLTVDEAPCDTT